MSIPEYYNKNEKYKTSYNLSYNLENNLEEYGYMKKKEEERAYVDLTQGNWGDAKPFTDYVGDYIKDVDPDKEIKGYGRRQFSDEWAQIEVEWRKLETKTKQLAVQKKDLDERERKLALKPSVRLKEALAIEAAVEVTRGELRAGQEKLRADKRLFAAQCRKRLKDIDKVAKDGQDELSVQRKQLDKERADAAKLYKKQKQEIQSKLQAEHDRKLRELNNELARLRKQRHEQSDKEADLIAREINLRDDEARVGKGRGRNKSNGTSRIEL